MTPSRSLPFAVWILASLAFGFLLHEAATIFLWIVTSFFLFLLLDPTAQKLKTRGNSTLITSFALVLAATVVTCVLIFMLGHFSASMLMELEASKKIFAGYYEQLDHSWKAFSNGLTNAVQTSGPPDATLGKTIAKVEVVHGSPFGGELGTTVMHGLGSAVTIFTFMILCPILTFFFLAERDSLVKVTSRAFSDPARGAEMWQRIVAATRAFFLGNLVLGLVTYPIFVVLFLSFSVPSAFTMAGLASFFNLIPFLGSVLSGFLPALTVLGQGDRVVASLGVYACCVAVHFAVANFVTPKVLGSKVDINATTSTIALIAWGELWGGLGLVLAIPITAAIKIVFQYSGYEWLEWAAALMSDNVDHALKPRSVIKTEMTAEPTNEL